MDGNRDIQKIDLDKVDWRGSREFFESLGEALDKLDDKDEAYDFTWVGKRKAIIEAGAPINKTFRPDVDASKNWDTTENLFIEGDNLDALKLLQESYLGKIKMIYIDPPYNTGKDFVYHDNFRATVEDYDETTEYRDDEGNIQFSKKPLQPSLKTNGRFHSDWLSMMYPRLKLARNLLINGGVIFMSIDDNEFHNLRKVADEIFGEDDFVGVFKWNRAAKAPSLSDTIRTKYEYVLCYKRGVVNKFFGKISYNTHGPVWHNPNRQQELLFPARSIQIPASFNKGLTSPKYQVELLDDIIEVDGLNKYPVRIKACSAWGQNKINQYLKDGHLFLIKKDIGTLYASLTNSDNFVAPSDLISRGECDVENNTDASAKLEKMGIPFTNPKPVSLVKYLINMVTHGDPDAIILDFFSGSATTAHATMQLNADDGGNRKWLMVQLLEETYESSEAFKSGYKTIPEISRERIRRAGDTIAAEHPDAKVDYGFRSLTIVDTNYKDVYKSASETTQLALSDTVDNIKEDRTELDLLYGILTATALELNRPLETRDIGGSSVYLYDYFSEVSGLIACFSESVSEETIKAIAALKPLTAVFKDSSFPDSQAKVNLSEHFRILSPETKVKVI